MKKTLVLLFTLTLANASLCSEPPPHAKAIVAAAISAGLLTPRDFTSKVLSPEELQTLKRDIKKQNWIADIPGLESALLSNYPAEIGRQEKPGFGLWVHYSGETVMLLRASVPLVNGDQREQKAMIETMLAATEALAGRDSGVRRWLDAEWQRSWEISAKLFEQESIDRSEIIRKKEFGPFLVTVWGVVPDIIFLNCVRRKP